MPSSLASQVVRSPDGASKGFPLGEMSVQAAAAFVLDKYYTEFPVYNPYLDRMVGGGGGNGNAGGGARQRTKVYDIDGGGGGKGNMVGAQIFPLSIFDSISCLVMHADHRCL